MRFAEMARENRLGDGRFAHTSHTFPGREIVRAA